MLRSWFLKVFLMNPPSNTLALWSSMNFALFLPLILRKYKWAFILQHNFKNSSGEICSSWRVDLASPMGFFQVSFECPKTALSRHARFSRHGELWSSENLVSLELSHLLLALASWLAMCLVVASFRASWMVTSWNYFVVANSTRCGEFTFACLSSLLSLILVLFTLFLHNWIK